MSTPKIGILGTGEVGQTLGTGFLGLGHDVKMGSRDAHNDKMAQWITRSGSHASGGTFADAAAFGDILVLATLWSATGDIIAAAKPDNFRGKVVIDTTNPLDFSKGIPALAVGHTDSGGEQLQRWLPGAQVVKAFNTVGNPHMVNPTFPQGKPDMFIAGDDEAARRAVAGICERFGWSVVDMGGMDAARLLEPLAMLWVRHFLRTQTGNHAFALLRK